MNKTKRILSVILTMVLLFTGIPVSFTDITANAVTIDGELEIYEDFVFQIGKNVSGKEEATIIYYLGNKTDVTIPEKIKNVPVVHIYKEAFDAACGSDDFFYENNDNTNIERVVIPDTVETIGEDAFYGCKKLKEVKLSANLKRIGDNAFYNCASLENLEFGNKLEYVGRFFLAYTQIKDVVFTGGAGVQLEIESQAFENSSVKNITVKSDYLKVFQNSFRNTPFLNEVIIEGEVTHFPAYVFGIKGVSNSKDAEFPNRVIFKNKFVDDVYENAAGYYQNRYIDDWENTGWTVFFRNESEAEWLTDGDYTYFLKDDKAVITEYNGEINTKIVIPQTLGGKTVSEIGYAVFRDADAVTEVSIPSNIEKIGAFAFDNCDKLKKVTYESDALKFSMAAFRKCIVLEKFVFPENAAEIPDSIFEGCVGLTSVIANGAKVIGDSAFMRCSSLEFVSFSPELNTVKPYGFYGCAGIESIGVSGEKITQLGKSAFNLSGIKSFIISDEITEVPDSCFAYSELSSVLIPDSVKVIGACAFEKCEISELDLPDSLTVIGNYAFGSSAGITELNLPEKLKSIGTKAFYNCANLSGTLRLESNIEYVGDNAFEDTNLTKLYYNLKAFQKLTEKGIPLNISAFEGIVFDEITFGDDVEIISKNIFANQYKITSLVIPDKVTLIDSAAFANCTNLKELSLPTNLKEIKDNAFYGCKSLEEFTIPKGVRSICESAIPPLVKTVYFNAEDCNFKELKKDDRQHEISPFAQRLVENVIIGDTVRRIPDHFLAYCDFIDAVILPDSVTEIGKEAFAWSEIKTINLPDGLISIEDLAFAGNEIEIGEYYLPESLRMIGKSVFAACKTQERVYIPDSVVYIGESVFANCDNLEVVRVSPNVKYIMDSTFYSCSKLRLVEWGADVKLIGHNAFARCESLTEFDFRGVEMLYPNSFDGAAVKTVMLGETKTEEASELISVDEQSFKNCTDLETLSVGGNVTTIKSEAFAECDSLETAVISDSVVNIASDAFEGCELLTICCMEDSYAYEYAVKNDIPVSTFVVAPIPNHTYTGKEIEPEVNVSMSGKELEEKVDFSVKYNDNINVGTAKVTVKGKEIYKALVSIANFTIITKNLSTADVAAIADQNYTGNAVTPSLAVTDSGNVLKEGIDYTVTYKNNTEVGTATVTIKGTGNYSGTKSVSFNITKQTLFQRLKNTLSTFFAKIKAWFVSIFS